MNKLAISESLSLPLDFVAMTVAILARKGSGKTYTSAVLTEEMLDKGQQVVILDPVGVWWGLKSSADGHKVGYAIAVFGGDHQDIELEPASGKVIADAIVDHGFSCILDLSLMTKGEMARFAAAFLETLYRRNRNSMHLVVDEADAFAPQRTFGIDDAKTLGAMQTVVRRGRARGIGVTMITQRPQVLSKDVLTQADVLITLRLGHPKDIDAIEEWVNVHADPREAKSMIDSLPDLPTGTAWVWAPMLKIFEKVAIRRRTTFDSSATPKPGEKTITPKVLAPIDLKRLGQEISQAAEEQKANSPDALRRRIAELERDRGGLEAARAGEKMLVDQIQQMETELIALRKRSILINAAKTQFQELAERMQHLADAAQNFAQALEPLSEPAAKSTPPAVEVVWPEFDKFEEAKRGVPASVEVSVPADVTIPQMRILEALARCLSIRREHVSRTWVAFLSGASPKSSSFTNNLGSLRTRGLIDYINGLVVLTDKGRLHVKFSKPALTPGELHNRVIEMLPAPQGRLLSELLKRPMTSIPRPKLAELAGASPTSSSFTNNLGAMRSLGLIDYGAGGTVSAKGDLFL